MERAERPEPYPEIDEELASLLSLDERGWLYDDRDLEEGLIYRDKYNTQYFVPDGFRPWYSDDDGYQLHIPTIEVGEGLDEEDDLSDDDDD